VDVPVSEVLCAHIIEMVGGLEHSPVVEKALLAEAFDFLFETIQLVDGIRLHRVAKPRGQVSFNIGPAYHVRHVNDADGRIRLYDLAGRLEIIVRVFEDFIRQMPHKVEDSGFLPLMFAEGFVVHKEVYDEAVAVDLVYPAGELVGGQRPLTPVAVGEPESDVIAERIVFEQQFEVIAPFGAVNEIGASVAEDVVSAFADNGVETTHRLYEVGQLVIIYKLGVSEDAWRLAKELLHCLDVLVDLLDKLVARIEET